MGGRRGGQGLIEVSLVPATLVVIAAIEDLRRQRIPDPVVLAIAATSPLVAVLGGDRDIAWHLACGGGVLVIGLALAWVGWLGAGDAKLMAAVSCWTGFGGLVPFLCATALSGALIALALLTAGRRHRGMPFAPAIAIGTLVAFLVPGA
ncbi:MAG: prepilin peptidase [bacterium]|nr:prepilin peptidase [bacterium]